MYFMLQTWVAGTGIWAQFAQAIDTVSALKPGKFPADTWSLWLSASCAAIKLWAWRDDMTMRCVWISQDLDCT